MYTGYWSHYGHQPPNCHHFYPALLVAREIDAVRPRRPRKASSAARGRSSSPWNTWWMPAASPTVKVTTAAAGSSATWSDDTPAEGYTVRQAVLSAAPGTKVTLAVNNAIARLRWCELVCC